MLYTLNLYNIINQLYLNLKIFKKIAGSICMCICIFYFYNYIPIYT